MPANDTVLLRTGLLHEADMLCAALEEAAIPFARAQESTSGVTVAMPVAPSSGPGILWLVAVPKSHGVRAAKVLARLPIDHSASPGPWSFNPTPTARVVWTYLAFGLLAALALGIASAIRGFFR